MIIKKQSFINKFNLKYGLILKVWDVWRKVSDTKTMMEIICKFSFRMR